ncbi:hypothetical protein, partial [Salmonella enterica]
IVHSIALAMGGSVVCDESELGGAKFSFHWPVWHASAIQIVCCN